MKMHHCRFVSAHDKTRHVNPACGYSHHDGQSKGGGPSLLVLVAILIHLRSNCILGKRE